MRTFTVRIDLPVVPLDPPRVPALFRRRTVWWPTLTGALVLLVIATLAIVLAARQAGEWLHVDEPAHGGDGRGARVLVVEGWLDEDALDAAVVAFREGRYERVVTSGGPIEGWREGQTASNFAERAAGYLKRHGLADVPVDAAPTPAIPQDRTFLSALVVRDWIRRRGLAADAIDIYSDSVHARRSRAVYRLAFGPNVEVGVRAARPRTYDLARWWRTSQGTKSVLDETISLTWTTCCFWPTVPP